MPTYNEKAEPSRAPKPANGSNLMYAVTRGLGDGRRSLKEELSTTMVAGHLLAAPDRIVTNLESILEEHGIACEVEYTKERDHSRHVVDLTSLICRHGKTQVGVGIEKRRGRNGVDIVLAPECRSFFRRNLDSEKLAERIAEILCQQGASEEPHARCEDME